MKLLTSKKQQLIKSILYDLCKIAAEQKDTEVYKKVCDNIYLLAELLNIDPIALCDYNDYLLRREMTKIKRMQNDI